MENWLCNNLLLEIKKVHSKCYFFHLGVSSITFEPCWLPIFRRLSSLNSGYLFTYSCKKPSPVSPFSKIRAGQTNHHLIALWFPKKSFWSAGRKTLLKEVTFLLSKLFLSWPQGFLTISAGAFFWKIFPLRKKYRICRILI